MTKAQRLVELMMTVNRMRTFTAKELAREFGVSVRTIIRDLQELSEIGVPLYSEVGPHGGYRVLKERLLPPIAFTEEEALAMFFAAHALRHYASLPFEQEAQKALAKFYRRLAGDIRDRIDQIRERFDFITPLRTAPSPHLARLLDGAVEQSCVQIAYGSSSGSALRTIVPIAVYAHNGLWYCPAYCVEKGEVRLFRCDRIASAQPTDDARVDKAVKDRLARLNLSNWFEGRPPAAEPFRLHVQLTAEGVQACEGELWTRSMLVREADGSGCLQGELPGKDIAFFADFIIGLGHFAAVREPSALRNEILHRLRALTAHHLPSQGGEQA